MKRQFAIVTAVFVGIVAGVYHAQADDNVNQAWVTQNLTSVPLAFTQNMGQWDERALFRADAGGATMWITSEGVHYQFTRRIERPDAVQDPSGSDIRLEGANPRGMDDEADSIETMVVKAAFVGANPHSTASGDNLMDYRCNYFLGNDPAKWRTDVPNYEAITLNEVYPGIDLTYYGNGHQMEYDFVVSPGADYSQIQIKYEGAKGLAVADDGALVVTTSWGEFKELAPMVYQEVGGSRRPVASEYIVQGDHSFGFRLGDNYDRALPVVIDPVLVYGTYLGGSGYDYGYGIAVDGAGSAYVTGYTGSSDFPTATALDGGLNGTWDSFVTKLSPAGNGLVYSTYLGGSNNDYGTSIAVDGSGSTYIAGYTNSADFPTATPFDGSFNGGAYDAFLTKLSPAGSDLVYSTYLGGSGDDWGNGIAVDGVGSAYVAGRTYSADFPTVNPFDDGFNGSSDAFVTKLSSAGVSLVYSTYLGGSGNESADGVSVDVAGSAYVTGWTGSTNYPTVNPFDGGFNGSSDAFVTKLSSAGVSLVYSTYLGGSSNDYGTGIAVDGSSNAYVTGFTVSVDFPTAAPFDGSFNGGPHDSFVTRLNLAGNGLVYSTYLGGSGEDYGFGIAVDGAGSAYLTGYTGSADFPVANALDGSYNGGSTDAFFAKLPPSGNSLSYSSYYGGSYQDHGTDIAIDCALSVGEATSVYVTGYTASTNFPTLAPLDGSANGGLDAFVMRLRDDYVGPTWHVATSGNDDLGFGSMTAPFATIQHAIDMASDGDTVLVADGTYTGDGNRDIDLRGKSLALLSANGKDKATIDCGGSSSDPHVAMMTGDYYGPTPKVSVVGFTITGAYGYNAILVISVNFAMSGCTVIDNQASGLLVWGSDSLDVTDCLFEANAGSGVSMQAWGDNKHLTNVRFVNNASDGLSVRDGNGMSVVDSCVFAQNAGSGISMWGDDYGPGLVITSSVFDGNQGCGLKVTTSPLGIESPNIVSDCLFSNNHGSTGGAIELDGGMFTTVDVTNCRFLGNMADVGGGVYVGWGGGDVHITNCLFDQNAADDGAAIGFPQYLWTNVVVSRCTFVRNQSGPTSGSIDVKPVFNPEWGVFQLVLENSTIAFAAQGQALRCTAESAPVLLHCVDIFANAGGDWIDCIAEQYGQSGNICVDPLFCDAANGNYALYNVSPCASANSSCGQLIGAYDVACTLSWTLVLPDEIDSLHVVSHMPDITWSWSPKSGFQQTEFEIAFGTDSNWSIAEMWNPAPLVSPDTQIVYAGAPLVDGATYYARVRSKLSGSWTPWYQTSFRMNSLPAKPTAASPHDGASTGNQPTLYVGNSTDAEGDPLEYQFYLYNSPGDQTALLVSDPVPQGSDSTGWAATDVLSEDSVYAWRCVAFDGYEPSDTSNWFFFAVNSNPEAPSKPTVIAPVGADLILYDMLPTFYWTEVTDPDPFDEVGFRLELAFTSNFGMVISVDSIVEPTYRFADSLQFSQHYWWRVKAIDKTGLFSTSDPSDFWTWTLGDINRNHVCTIGDISLLIDHLFISGAPIDPPKVGDVNATCDITIGDVSLMIDHLFISGAQFKAGCE